MNIATVLRYADLGGGGPWAHRYYIMNDYLLMAQKYGVGLISVLTEESIADICRHCDGLIIPGSATDIDPKYYGGAPLETPPIVDEYALDAALIRHFFEAGKPIFGVCGGEQAINVFFGGTISRVAHPENHTDGMHPIQIEKGSFVYDVFGTERATVNTYHGWWTDRVAPDFRAVARADDGTVEAIEWKEKNIFATQWHPEQSFHTGDPIEHRFFENFLRVCEECALHR